MCFCIDSRLVRLTCSGASLGDFVDASMFLPISRFPKLQAGAGGMAESTFSEKSILSGRVVADTYLLAKDLVKSSSYSLTSLAASLLDTTRVEISMDTQPIDWAKLVSVCENDAYLSGQLMFKLVVLPLTCALTRLAGNLWYFFYPIKVSHACWCSCRA